jgi:hypothetical protein
MTQEDKELLLKDLCARLPYGVKIQAKYNPINIDANVEIEKVGVLSMVDNDAVIAFACDDTNTYNYVTIHDVKPYLFPFSSMTDELWKEYQTLKMTDWVEGDINGVFINAGTITDWLNKNHFDYRGLIEKGLAINATNLNIYIEL